jgi:hypothetical protein
MLACKTQKKGKNKKKCGEKQKKKHVRLLVNVNMSEL